ncbi:MAG: cell division protein CrgA [Acidimicrobiales bacterium]
MATKKRARSRRTPPLGATEDLAPSAAPATAESPSAKRPNRRPAKTTGRVTPKGSGRTPPRAAGPAPSGRYTPPIPRTAKVSPKWVPVLMMFLLLAGPIVIIINYIGLMPGGASNYYLLAGLLLISGGFLVATQYR